MDGGVGGGWGCERTTRVWEDGVMGGSCEGESVRCTRKWPSVVAALVRSNNKIPRLKSGNLREYRQHIILRNWTGPLHLKGPPTCMTRYRHRGYLPWPQQPASRRPASAQGGGGWEVRGGRWEVGWEVGGGGWEVGGGRWEVGGGRWEVGGGVWGGGRWGGGARVCHVNAKASYKARMPHRPSPLTWLMLGG